MKITIAILVLLLATITATVFTVKDSPPSETLTSETQTTFSTTEKETATEILSVTESETYEIETETVAPTTERKIETTTQKSATTKPIATTTQRATVPSTPQPPVTTTKPVTTTVPTTTQPTTRAYIDIDYYINFAIEYGKSIGLTYCDDATSCWDTPIGVLADNEYYVTRDVKDRLEGYRYHDGDEYFTVWAEPHGKGYWLFIGYA
jgi:hypothetical protein